MSVTAKMTFHYEGKSYPFEMEFDSPDSVEYMFTSGNYSCDCNRCLFIQRVEADFNGDEDMGCGDTIEMTDFRIEG
jgi:hypothetical protein